MGQRLTRLPCARLLRGPLGLDALLGALRRFFWQGAGDWAAALAGGLCRAAAAARPLRAPQLCALLDEALRVRGAPLYLAVLHELLSTPRGNRICRAWGRMGVPCRARIARWGRRSRGR